MACKGMHGMWMTICRVTVEMITAKVRMEAASIRQSETVVIVLQ